MTPDRHRRVTAALIPAVLWLVFGAAAVQAHAELDTMTPADKSSVPRPTAIVATFTENLDPSGSNLAVVDSAGKVVAEGGTIDATNKKKLTLDLTSTALDEETYTVRWTSKSADDGDIDRGTTTFLTIAGPSLVPSVDPSPSGSAAPSAAPSSAPTPSATPSGGTGTPTSSTDALIPIVAVIVVIALLGLWLLRGRGRRAV